MKQWLIDRGSEKSTWAGLVGIVALLTKTQLDEGTVNVVCEFLVWLSSVVAVVLKEKAGG